MDNTSYTTDSTLLAHNLALKEDLALHLRAIDRLEQDLQDGNRRQEAANAAVTKAQCESRTSKEQLKKAEKRQEYDMRSLMADLDSAVTANEVMKRKFHVLAEAKDAAKNEIEDLKMQAQQDSDQYEANKRLLERKAHLAGVKLKTLLEAVQGAGASEPAGRLMTDTPYPSGKEVDCSSSFNPGMIESPAMRNTRTLDNELDFEYCDSDEEQVDNDCRDMESLETQIETTRSCDRGIQVDFDDQRDEADESPVESVGFDIMEKLDELALICADLGMKSVKIYRSADWMVVLFP